MTITGLNLADIRLTTGLRYDLELSLSESGKMVNILFNNIILFSIDPLKEDTYQNLFVRWEINMKNEFLKELDEFIKRKD